MLQGIPHILSLQLHSGKLIHFSAKGKQTLRNTVDRQSGKLFPPTRNIHTSGWLVISTLPVLTCDWQYQHLLQFLESVIVAGELKLTLE